MSLENARVVVLGGTSGLGYAVAERALREGARVVVASSRAERVEAASAALDCEGRVADLGDERSIAALFETLGELDHLVYTAGEPLATCALDALELASARSFLDVRLWGALTAAKHGAPRIRSGGSIVLTSGTAGRRPRAGWAVPALLCGAIESLTRALAAELAPIRVNAVCAGVVRSPLWRGIAEDAREAMYREVGASLPLGRVGEPEDLAEAYAYLMRAQYSTGQIVVVDGGGTMGG